MPRMNPTMATTFSSTAAAALAGVTYRQADYWCRLGVLNPANNGRGSGSGHERRFSPEDVALLRVAGRLAKLGAGTDVMGRVCAALRQFPMVTWGGRILVTAAGEVHTDEAPLGSAWMVDLGSCVADLPVA
jgi:DNA-binding transcriptional MerR regulator